MGIHCQHLIQTHRRNYNPHQLRLLLLTKNGSVLNSTHTEENTSFKMTYFNDDDDDDDLEVREGSPNSINGIFKNTKQSNIRKLKQKAKDDIKKCTVKAEIEAEAWRCRALESNPLNKHLTKHSNLNQVDMLNLGILKQDLENRVRESNFELLRLIEVKDVLEQKSEE